MIETGLAAVLLWLGWLLLAGAAREAGCAVGDLIGNRSRPLRVRREAWLLAWELAPLDDHDATLWRAWMLREEWRRASRASER